MRETYTDRKKDEKKSNVKREKKARRLWERKSLGQRKERGGGERERLKTTSETQIVRVIEKEDRQVHDGNESKRKRNRPLLYLSIYLSH